MKFLKPDGSIEDGEPLTDEQAELREMMERFLHIEVCHNAYHSSLGVEPCRQAANFLALKTTGITPQSAADNLKAAVEARMPKPRRIVPEPRIAVPLSSQPDVESPIAVSSDIDPF
jgi:hypothetical protein